MDADEQEVTTKDAKDSKGEMVGLGGHRWNVIRFARCAGGAAARPIRLQEANWFASCNLIGLGAGPAGARTYPRSSVSIRGSLSRH